MSIAERHIDRNAHGTFAQWQPRYAEHGIATFPVADKRPCVRGYLKLGTKYSDQLALRFPQAEALGFACGARSRISVLDVDTTDENILADAMAELGPSPLIVRTASGKWHAYYRHNGERRRIRPDPRRPVDILGGGFAIAPPSAAAHGRYQLVQGTLDDLDRLPCMRPAIDSGLAKMVPASSPVRQGQRNDALFDSCRAQARSCQDETELVAFAIQWNAQNCIPPDDHGNVMRTAHSAWGYEQRGRVRKEHADIATRLAREGEHVIGLYHFLQAHNRPTNTFNVTNTLADVIGWNRKRLADARKRLLDLGLLVLVREAYTGCPAVYRWSSSTGRL